MIIFWAKYGDVEDGAAVRREMREQALREKKRRGDVECHGILVLLRCDCFKGSHGRHRSVVYQDVERTACCCDLLNHRVNTLIGGKIGRGQAFDGLSQVLLGACQLFCIAADETQFGTLARRLRQWLSRSPRSPL